MSRDTTLKNHKKLITAGQLDITYEKSSKPSDIQSIKLLDIK